MAGAFGRFQNHQKIVEIRPFNARRASDMVRISTTALAGRGPCHAASRRITASKGDDRMEAKIDAFLAVDTKKGDRLIDEIDHV